MNFTGGRSLKTVPEDLFVEDLISVQTLYLSLSLFSTSPEFSRHQIKWKFFHSLNLFIKSLTFFFIIKISSIVHTIVYIDINT